MATSLIYVHIGSTLPEHLATSLAQSRMFNPEISIFVAASHQAIDNRSAIHRKNRAGIHWVALESVPKGLEHIAWLETVGRIPPEEMYWYYTRQRFLFLHDLISHLGTADVWHLECDNLIFSSLTSLTSRVKARYTGIAATFNNDYRCIPGCLFIPGSASMKPLSATFVELAAERMSDMKIIAHCALAHGPHVIGYLPIICSPYLADHPLNSDMNALVRDAHSYAQPIDEEESLYDASAHGQFLDGTTWGKAPGYVTAECIFDPSHFVYEWHKDDQHRLVPFVCYRQRRYRLNNLHIQSKRLDRFASFRPVLFPRDCPAEPGTAPDTDRG